MSKFTFIMCNPEASVFAELEAEHQELVRDRDLHMDTVEFPETRCGVCQGEDPSQTLTVSGGTLMCEGCLEVTLGSGTGSVAEQ